MNEHLWSGIIHRSETGEERKEDDINVLDLEGFKEWLKKHYINPNDKYKIQLEMYADDSVSVPLTSFGFKESSFLNIELRFNEGENKIVMKNYDDDLIIDDYKLFFKNTTFVVQKDGYYNRYKVTSQDPERQTDHKLFVEVLDYLIDYFGKDCLTQKIK